MSLHTNIFKDKIRKWPNFDVLIVGIEIVVEIRASDEGDLLVQSYSEITDTHNANGHKSNEENKIADMEELVLQNWNVVFGNKLLHKIFTRGLRRSCSKADQLLEN